MVDESSKPLTEKKTSLQMNFDHERKNDRTVIITDYQQELGSLGFLGHTSLVMLSTTHELAEFVSKPTEYSKKMTNHQFDYLKRTKAYGRTCHDLKKLPNEMQSRMQLLPTLVTNGSQPVGVL